MREVSEPVAPVVPPLSIVVLPFANLSNDPEQEYFADGITDDLTTDLSRISGSFVIARPGAPRKSRAARASPPAAALARTLGSGQRRRPSLAAAVWCVSRHSSRYRIRRRSASNHYLILVLHYTDPPSSAVCVCAASSAGKRSGSPRAMPHSVATPSTRTWLRAAARRAVLPAMSSR
jgi:hypothetical protein